jgi:hypothetical protein
MFLIGVDANLAMHDIEHGMIPFLVSKHVVTTRSRTTPSALVRSPIPCGRESGGGGGGGREREGGTRCNRQ